MYQYVVLIVLALSIGVQAKRCVDNEVHLKIDRAVKPGDSATLKCQFRTGEEPLHSVRWYKGDKEFFRFVHENSEKKVFIVPGINVDEGASSVHEVVLKNVQNATAGQFKCEVSVVVPNIATSSDTARLNIITAPKGEPALTVDNDYVGIGDRIHAVCTAPPSFPPPEITWYLDGEQVQYDVSSSRQRNHHGETAPITSFLVYRIGYETFKTDNKANLTCIARVPNTYYGRKSIILEKNPEIRLAAMNGATSSSFVRMDVLSAVVLGVLWLQYK